MTTKNCWNDETAYDFGALVGSLNQYLRLRTTPVGMKRFRAASDRRSPAWRRATEADSR